MADGPGLLTSLGQTRQEGAPSSLSLQREGTMTAYATGFVRKHKSRIGSIPTRRKKTQEPALSGVEWTGTRTLSS